MNFKTQCLFDFLWEFNLDRAKKIACFVAKNVC